MNKFLIFLTLFTLQLAEPSWATSQTAKVKLPRYYLSQLVSSEKAREACLDLPLRYGAILINTVKIKNEVDKTHIEIFNFIFTKKEDGSFAIMPLIASMHVNKDGMVYYISEFSLGKNDTVMNIYYSKSSDTQKLQFNYSHVELFKTLNIELQQWIEKWTGGRAREYPAGSQP